jgi:hypothetical protein
VVCCGGQSLRKALSSTIVYAAPNCPDAALSSPAAFPAGLPSPHPPRSALSSGPLSPSTPRTPRVFPSWSAAPSSAQNHYHRLAARRGKKWAIVAVAHSMLVSAWHILTYQQPYQELGGDYFDERKKESTVSYLIRRLEKLTDGSVSIELQPTAA